MLFGVIGAAFVVVAALAVLTPTVIVDDDGPDVGLLAAAGPLPVAPPQTPPQGRPAPQPGPARPFQKFRGCLEQHGFGRPDRGTPPEPGRLRDALKACRGALPGAPPGP
jgi:hypothetical protein